MQKTGLHVDTTPFLPAAGKKGGSLHETAAACFVDEERPPTPEHIRRFRKSYVKQPGKRTQHWGLANDPAPRPSEFTYGALGSKSRGVDELMGSHAEPSSMQAYQQMRAETIYESNKKEQLGKTLNRQYEWPKQIAHDETFRFGVQGSKEKVTAIEVILPSDAPSLNVTEEQKEMYKLSHYAYEPGEQKNRKYDWQKAGIDPVTHVFGATAEIDYKDGVAKAFNPDLEYDSKVQPTEFMPKSVADFKKVRQDELGKVKNLGLGRHPVPPDYTYGISYKRADDWGAKECIQGNYTEEEQLPDPDLGRSLRRGCAPDEVLVSERTFGVPNVRNDIKPPKFQSVADSKNYGNEPGAKALLYPQPYATRGVYEEDFLRKYPKGELYDIAINAGFCESTEEFEKLYSVACVSSGVSEDEMISLDAIRRAMYAISLE
mmetsp:Transcript_27861/g.63019  ORF Transcript_27861/g.63019 Transcript_27861/m.63019 type:complete len:431 (-) Transcript_27861:504-1796(-)